MENARFLSPEHSATLHLQAGTGLHCIAGRLWLTLECGALPGASPDILLEAGKQHRMPGTGRAFLHALGPGTVRYAVLSPMASAPNAWPLTQTGWWARASAWIQAATRRTSSRGTGSACSSQ